MGVSGFPIKATTSGSFITSEPWFDTAFATFDQVFNINDKASFVVSNLYGFRIGQTVDILLSTNYNGSHEITKIINNGFDQQQILTDADIIDTDTGNATVDGSIEWDEETPRNIEREIIVQFAINGATPADNEIQVSMDDENSWQLLFNGNFRIGLHTFPMFVTRDTLLNFRMKGAIGTTPRSIVCTIFAG